MTESVGLLMREFLTWATSRRRTYADVMEAWRSTCPRHTVWEDALADGLVQLEGGGPLPRSEVVLTPRGRALLDANRATPYNVPVAAGGHAMMDGPSVVEALRTCGVSHVVWVPDSEIGRWESALSSAGTPALVRACREGEALAIAAGLYLGGARPIVMVQCTGLFEAGDALRNVVHDLGLPLFLVVGVRSWKAHQKGTTRDNCPRFTEPILRAWEVEHRLWDEARGADDLVEAWKAHAGQRPFALLLPE